MTVRPGNLAGVSCDVRGCDRVGVFHLTRTMRGDHHPTVVLLIYCADHYSAANRFHLADRDHRPLQTTA